MIPTDSIILELQYLPSISFFTKLQEYDCVLLEAHENYSKGSYRNRCHIAAVNGLQRLSVPLKKGKNRQQNIREVQIAYDEAWQAQHWTAIQSAYGNAPFFEFYSEELQPFFRTKYQFLWDLNLALLNKLIALVGIGVQLENTSAYFSADHYSKNSTVADYRNCIHPKKSGLRNDPSFKPVVYGQVFYGKTWIFTKFNYFGLAFLYRSGGTIRAYGMYRAQI